MPVYITVHACELFQKDFVYGDTIPLRNNRDVDYASGHLSWSTTTKHSLSTRKKKIDLD
jgi:hypothetical protein